MRIVVSCLKVLTFMFLGFEVAIESSCCWANKSGEDELLFDCLDRMVGSDDDVDMKFIQAKLNSAAEPVFIDEDSEGSWDTQTSKGSHLNSNSDGNLSDANKKDHKIGHALLDLGASVNLLPYSVYQQLNLGMD
ncbi:uncharacterized protein LOC102626240 isoform X1 [Citrus sinensis]|uniref:uncharacterized protein LOC102626240 isoform X1 n=1 Tax=Citrus sinensis TaxID=2711 RepID=UPI0022795151|nr:uncharacterized protein LOC102626240 isoform X1 [Citrus sinensis]